MQPDFEPEIEVPFQQLGDNGEQMEKSGMHATQGHFRPYIILFLLLYV